MCESFIDIDFEQILKKQKCIDKEYFNILKERFYLENKKVKTFITSIFMEHINNDKSFALFDENIFEIYKSIIDKYKILLYKNHNINYNFNEHVDKNLSGIICVLKSQVSAFYEVENKELSINPIYVEKKTLISNYIDIVYSDIDNIINMQEDLFLKIYVENKSIKDEFLNYLVEKISNIYQNILIDCFHSINDIQNRRILSYYIYALEEEKEILTSIIKVQIKVLEDLCETEEEKDIVETFIKPIREIYQQTSKSFYDLSEKIKNIDSTVNIEFEQDKERLIMLINKVFIDMCLHEQRYKEEILNIFDNFIINLFKQSITYKEIEIETFKDKVRNLKIASDLIKEEFEVIFRYINKNKRFYEELELYSVIEGIYESISIKVENILERSEEVFNNINEIFLSIDNEFKNIKTIDKVEYDFDFIYKELIKEQNITNLNNFIQKDIISKTFITINNIMKNYFKELDEFIKNTLLFEISTFQEIIYYSVARIGKEKDLEIQEFVKYICKIEFNIEKILEKNDIFKIKPKPHDLFNAKEHEVLIAEKNEDFIKGEIIKVINYGYINKDKVVIKRAMVIVAK